MAGVILVLHEKTNSIGRFLTSEETIELARIQKDNSVIGYALLTPDGQEIESSGAWKDMLGPVFANVSDLADQMGRELGETDTCPMMVIESADFEVACVLLSSVRAIFIRRKTKDIRHGLRTIG